MRAKCLGVGVFGLAVSAWLAMPGAASAAPDAIAVADAVVAAAKAAGARTATYESAAADAGNVVIANLEISRSANTSVTVPKVVVVGPSDRDGGGFAAAEIVFDGGMAVSHGRTVGWRAARITDVVVPSAAEVNARGDIRPFATLSLGGVEIGGGGVERPGTIAEIEVACAAVTEGTPRSCVTRLKDVVVTAALLAGTPRERSVVDSLGYEEIRMNVTIDAGYDRAAGTAFLNSLIVNTDEGTLTLSARLSDLRIETAEGESLRANVTRKTRLDGFSLRFENRGFVERALAAQARATGVPVEEAPDQMGGMVMAALIAINNMEFAAEVAEATTSFLADPKSLTIDVAPVEPMALRSILSKVFTDSAGLVDQLGIDIKANR